MIIFLIYFLLISDSNNGIDVIDIIVNKFIIYATTTNQPKKLHDAEHKQFTIAMLINRVINNIVIKYGLLKVVNINTIPNTNRTVDFSQFGANNSYIYYYIIYLFCFINIYEFYSCSQL